MTITHPADHNRDGRVNAADMAVVRANFGKALPAPSPLFAAATSTAAPTPGRRTAYTSSAAIAVLLER